MRANVPTDSEDVMRPVVDDQSPVEKITKEQIELSKIGNSPDWQIIVKYLDARIDVYKNGLFGEDLTGKSAEIIGQRFLAAQSVVAEFQSLKDQVEQNTEAVNDAVRETASERLVRPQ